MKYVLWHEAEGWFWELKNGDILITDYVGPYESEVQAMVSMLAYASKVEL